MRLNKYIAQRGIASRRKADELIVNGNVKINGEPMKQLGYDVKEDDKVEVNGVLLGEGQKLVYYVMNKPVGYITSVKDEQDRPVVMDLLTDVNARVFPIGRLDYDTSGLLILTNDGDFSQRIGHPKNSIPKTYEALISGQLSRERVRWLKTGVDIDGYITKPAQVEVIKEGPSSSLVRITIHEGKNRQVRKMFKAVGNPVLELQRISIGELRLGRLMPGHYRRITPKELEYLKTL